MVGAFSLMGSPVIDSPNTGPCLCLDTMSSSSMNLKGGGDGGLSRKSLSRKQSRLVGSLELSSSFVDPGKEMLSIVNRSYIKQRKVQRRPVIVGELGGQYDDTFADVKTTTKSNHHHPKIITSTHHGSHPVTKWKKWIMKMMKKKMKIKEIIS